MNKMYNMGGETADDKRYRMQMQKKRGSYDEGRLVSKEEEEEARSTERLLDLIETDEGVSAIRQMLADEGAAEVAAQLKNTEEREAANNAALDSGERRNKQPTIQDYGASLLEEKRNGRSMGGEMDDRDKYSIAGKVFRKGAEIVDTLSNKSKDLRIAVDKTLDGLQGITEETAGRTSKSRGIVVGKDRTKAFANTEFTKGAGTLYILGELYENVTEDEVKEIIEKTGATDADIEVVKTSASENESGKRINPSDYPVYEKNSKSAMAFRKAQREAKKEGALFFTFEGREYNTTEQKAEGGMMKYAEGSMLMPPEMEMEEEMPEDTYDNIPEDEMAAVEASQLPDSEMEEDYTGYVLGQSLDTEEQDYLMGVLETDERLSGIFDKVMDVAGEFAGEGAVEGPGTGTSDSIPARLSDGEFVFTKKATDQMGADQLQTMMDDAERAYDGGYMKKAFGGLTNNPMEDEKNLSSYNSEAEVKRQMLESNQMPSIRKR